MVSWTPIPDEFRIFAAGTNAPKQCGYRQKVDSHGRFGNRQLLDAYLVGDSSPVAIRIETMDLRDEVWSLTRTLDLEPDQVVPILRGLQSVERAAVELENLSPNEWSGLPQEHGEAIGQHDRILVLLDSYNGRLEARLSKVMVSGSRRSNEWLKFGIQDIGPMAALFVKAHDALPPDGGNESTTESDLDSIPF